MVRLLYIPSVLALLLATCILFMLWTSGWCQDNWWPDEPLDYPSIVQVFRETGVECGGALLQVSPLVVQAEALAAYLNPPKSPDEPLTSAPISGPVPPVPPIRPATSLVKFRLHGTSYYPNQPGRSMALIAELGSAEGSERWVKEGSQLSHFVIHEIRHGAIIYRDRNR